MNRTKHRMSRERLEAVQDRRRSSAAGRHGRGERRYRTRTAAKQRAIGEYA